MMKGFNFYILILILYSCVSCIKKIDSKTSAIDSLLKVPIVVPKQIGNKSIPQEMRGVEFYQFIEKYGNYEEIRLSNAVNFKSMIINSETDAHSEEVVKLISDVYGKENSEGLYLVQTIWNVPIDNERRDKLLVDFIAIDESLISFYGYYYIGKWYPDICE